ncbi:MAG TPA: hypothetical protein VMS77_10045 [Conexivisphaerales archaeon]|nr:hypothetical protein [Conexivisphaerales archaeon]
MEDISLYKARISVLWILEALAYLAYLGFMIMAPGMISAVGTGTINGTPVDFAVLVFAILLTIIFVMALATLTLKDRINRWANVVAGAVYAVLEFIALLGVLSNPFAGIILMSALKVIIGALISVLAFRWPSAAS